MFKTDSDDERRRRAPRSPLLHNSLLYDRVIVILTHTVFHVIGIEIDRGCGLPAVAVQAKRRPLTLTPRRAQDTRENVVKEFNNIG